MHKIFILPNNGKVKNKNNFGTRAKKKKKSSGLLKIKQLNAFEKHLIFCHRQNGYIFWALYQDTKIHFHNKTGCQSFAFDSKQFNNIHEALDPAHICLEAIRVSPRVWSVHPSHRWWPLRFHVDATVHWCKLCREPWFCGRAWWSSSPRCSAFHLHPLTLHSCGKKLDNSILQLCYL